MKRLVTFFCGLLFAYTLYGQGVTINGKIDNKQVSYYTILLKQNNELIAAAKVDKDSRFQIKLSDLKTSTSNVQVDLLITGVGLDTSFIKSIVLIKNSAVNCDLVFPNPYNKNVLGDVTCPKCGKTNMTIPIVYGSFAGIHNNEMGAGTDVKSQLSPEWYCKRCNIKF